MLINAYQLFENYEGKMFRDLAQLFSKTAIEVCEGQQYDVDFESRDDVSIPEYLKMIEYKTAVLVGAALKMGGIIAGASPKDQNYIYEFGRNLGIAFQLQDDYLDAFGNTETFGKQIGGDIIENKKTYLYLKAMEKGSESQVLEMAQLYSIKPEEPVGKINTVKEIFLDSGAAEITKNAIKNYTDAAFEVLEKLRLPQEKQSILKAFGKNLMGRQV